MRAIPTTRPVKFVAESEAEREGACSPFLSSGILQEELTNLIDDLEDGACTYSKKYRCQEV